MKNMINDDSQRAVVFGFVALLIAMGIGRFSFTPILPLMQSQAGLSVSQAGYLASSHYLGYLIGAFCAGYIPWGSRRAAHLRMQLVLISAATGLMGLTASFTLWMVLRFISGVSSGLIFVLASSLVLDAMVYGNRKMGSGIFYGGVGIGIAMTGLLVPFLNQLTWRGTWCGLSVLGLLLTALVWPLIRDNKKEAAPPSLQDFSAQALHPAMFGWLLVAYGLEGLGYIVSATFLVALVTQIPQLQGVAAYSWVVVGVAAAPSTVFWSWWSGKIGYLKALLVAYALQAIGVILPLWLPDVVGVTVGSILFGGTFMGITTLATTAARLMLPAKGRQAIGLMTCCFGIGQIVGPLGAGTVMIGTDDYDLPLILAAVMLAFAEMILAVGNMLASRKREKGRLKKWAGLNG